MKKAFLFLMLGLALVLGLFLGAEPAGATPTPGWFVQLPVLAWLGTHGGPGSDVIIEVQNVGSIYTKAVLILWQKTSGFCEPQAPGPFKFECTGLLKPGSAWIWTEAQLPASAYSGIVIPVDHCPAKLPWPAWQSVTNKVPLAVEVLRKFPNAAGVDISSAYSGISIQDEGVRDPIYGGFMYYAPVVYASFNNLSSWLYIQNSGDECTSVELWFKQEGECLRAQICEIMQLAPGETAPFDVSTCVGPRGSARFGFGPASRWASWSTRSARTC